MLVKSEKIRSKEITGYWRLIGAKQYTISPDYPDDTRTIPVYDDGFGSLWMYRTTYGTDGIIRAMSWHDAFEIARDEFCRPADWNEIDEECRRELEESGGCEGYDWSPNSGLVEVDCNERLDPIGGDYVLEFERWE